MLGFQQKRAAGIKLKKGGIFRSYFGVILDNYACIIGGIFGFLNSTPGFPLSR
jgi:hypothetical protein